MGYAVKHSTSNVNKTFRKGNVALGVSSDGYEGTATSGLYNGVAPVAGKYNIVVTSATGDPDFYCVDENELPQLANTLGGSVDTPLAAKNYLQQQNNVAFVDDFVSNNTVTDGLVLYLDAKNQSSFLDNEPTTNLVTNPDFSTGDLTGWSSNSTFQDVEITGVFSEYGYYYFWKKFNKTVNGGSDRLYQSTLYNLDTGSNTTVTIEMWENPSNAYSIAPYGLGDTANDTTWNEKPLSSNSTIVTTENLEDGWVKYTYVMNTGWYTGTGSTFRVAIYPNWSGRGLLEYKVRKIQVEQKPYATTFVNGTRSQNTTWYDLSGNDENGSVNNGTEFENVGAFKFDGVDDYVYINSTVNLGNPCTVTALINPSNISSNSIFTPTANGHDNWLGMEGTSLSLRGTEIADVNNFSLSGGNLTCDGTRWYHVAGTISGSVAKIFVNGVEENSVTKAFTIGGWTGFAGIGRRGAISSRYYLGSIAEVKGYNKSLTGEELKQNYYGGPIVTDGLVLAVDASNLVSYESGSTVAYNLTGSISGSFYNGVAYNPRNGGVWEFDGSNDHISYLSPNTITLGTDWTISSWFHFTDTPSLANIFSTNYGEGWYAGSVTFSLGNGRLRWYLDSQWRDTGNLIVANQWYNLTAVVDGNDHYYYLNGKQVWSYTSTATPSSTAFGSIGKIGIANERYFPGYIANYYAYNKALTPSEVLQNYNAQKARFI